MSFLSTSVSHPDGLADFWSYRVSTPGITMEQSSILKVWKAPTCCGGPILLRGHGLHAGTAGPGRHDHARQSRRWSWLCLASRDKHFHGCQKDLAGTEGEWVRGTVATSRGKTGRPHGTARVHGSRQHLWETRDILCTMLTHAPVSRASCPSTDWSGVEPTFKARPFLANGEEAPEGHRQDTPASCWLADYCRSVKCFYGMRQTCQQNAHYPCEITLVPGHWDKRVKRLWCDICNCEVAMLPLPRLSHNDAMTWACQHYKLCISYVLTLMGLNGSQWPCYCPLGDDLETCGVFFAVMIAWRSRTLLAFKAPRALTQDIL